MFWKKTKVDLQELESRLLEHPDLSGLSPREQLNLLKSRAKHLIGEDRLLSYLERAAQEKRGLRAKVGFDATGAELHLGHMVQLVTIRRLQKMGHQVTLVVGDFTALIGDPAGRVAERPMLTESQVEQNLKTYEAQAAKLIDLKKVTVRRNSEWLAKLSLSDFFKMIRGLTVATAMQREDFRKRESVTRLELLYASLTGIDSIELKTELEFGGDDQLLNFYDAVRVMEANKQAPEAALTTDIIIGTSGQGLKMSKSLGNYVALTAKPEELYGKIMSIPDSLLEQYFKLLTDASDADIKALSKQPPMQVKRLLARVIVADLNSHEAALQAEQHFDQRVVNKDPGQTDVLEIPAKKATSWVAIVRLLNVPQAKSNSAARRLIEEGGLHRKEGDSEVAIAMTDPVPTAGERVTLRIGKREFRSFVISR